MTHSPYDGSEVADLWIGLLPQRSSPERTFFLGAHEIFNVRDVCGQLTISWRELLLPRECLFDNIVFDHAPRNTITHHRSRPISGSLHDEAHFWLNGYVKKQNCRIWSEANPQVYVELTLHPEKLTVWCALWAAGILLQKR
ncbi:uncharacterized protein TNCV_286731 [Trichonephila clavipes]|nr:uncharacterized protein TNCV_286731 [Trichonephila clavipes]